MHFLDRCSLAVVQVTALFPHQDAYLVCPENVLRPLASSSRESFPLPLESCTDDRGVGLDVSWIGVSRFVCINAWYTFLSAIYLIVPHTVGDAAILCASQL